MGMLFRTIAIALVGGLALQAAAIAQPVKYNIDNVHSSVIFGVGHLGISYTYGRFNKVGGEFVLDSGDVTKSTFKVTIDVASIDTNNAQRDEHLKTAEFFDVAKFPTIEFVSSEVIKTDKGMDVKGKLTLHGVTKELTIPLAKVGEGNSPFGDYRVGFLTQFPIKRSDYEMKSLTEAAGDAVTITFSIEGIKQQ
jgi:polyisoprenoid-binding protein YceI